LFPDDSCKPWLAESRSFGAASISSQILILFDPKLQRAISTAPFDQWRGTAAIQTEITVEQLNPAGGAKMN
jgi:hypothetical protein